MVPDIPQVHFMVICWYLPSGKRLHNYGKIHHFSWENSPISMAIFNRFLLVYQRVSTLWCFDRLPSGKRLHNYRKSPFSMGKLTINGHFQSLFWHNQRVSSPFKKKKQHQGHGGSRPWLRTEVEASVLQDAEGWKVVSIQGPQESHLPWRNTIFFRNILWYHNIIILFNNISKYIYIQ